MPGAVKVLNVAEKPSVAKEISRILSGGHAQSSRSASRFNPNYQFSVNLAHQTLNMTFTSVAGHLMELDFPASHKPWRSCDPSELFTAPVAKGVPQAKSDLRRNLEQEARKNSWLILWLDCDREGENIAFEVLEVCVRANPRLAVKRARFSVIRLVELRHALQNLVPPDQRMSAAVDARQEIDLRIGAAFSRFQTFLLQDKFDFEEPNQQQGDRRVFSYGPCQFPTLGLIVQRKWDIDAHQPEPFWYLELHYVPKGMPGCVFHWERGIVFDYDIAAMLHESCLDDPEAVVTDVSGRRRERQPPPPMSTLEMQKKAVRSLRISGDQVMKLAEELYIAGFISYPRTETDEFEDGYNLREMIEPHVNDDRWGGHAQALLDGRMWKTPSRGGHNDQAHPPIHPTKYSGGEPDWNNNKKRLYEFVVRSFLATCSKAAVGQESTVLADVAGEGFKATGLAILERNWLDVYPYTNWGGTEQLPAFHIGQTIEPTDMQLKQGTTQPPTKTSEPDLIAQMEAYGIGTDATVTDHINKQFERGYATKDADMKISPTPLGEGLVSGYRRVGLEGLWMPGLRGQIEANISRVAQGQDTKEQVVATAMTHFRREFQSAAQLKGTIEAEMARYFRRRGHA